MKYLRDYIKYLLADGKYLFTKIEAMQALQLSVTQFRFQAYRLLQKEEIAKLKQDLLMIVPYEYKHLGGPPPHWIIDPLMQHLAQDYGSVANF